MKILFVCSANVDRSPTAEYIYSGRRDLEVKSAGVGEFAQIPVSEELLQWADAILCMDKKHKQKLKKKFQDICANKTIGVLNVPDLFDYMDDDLVSIIKGQTDAWLGKYGSRPSV